MIYGHPTKTVDLESPIVGHFPTNMHMGGYVTVANVAQHKSILKLNFTWDQKGLVPYLPMKDLGMTTQK
jgi:hypothetical protein